MKNLFNSLFTNVGKKIKTILKVIFIIDVICGIIAGIVMFFVLMLGVREDFINALYAFLALIFIPVVTFIFAWFMSLPLFAFAELVENSYHTKEATQESLKYLASIEQNTRMTTVKVSETSDFTQSPKATSSVTEPETQTELEPKPRTSVSQSTVTPPSTPKTEPRKAAPNGTYTCPICHKLTLTLHPVQVIRDGQSVKLDMCYNCKNKHSSQNS